MRCLVKSFDSLIVSNQYSWKIHCPRYLLCTTRCFLEPNTIFIPIFLGKLRYVSNHSDFPKPLLTLCWGARRVCRKVTLSCSIVWAMARAADLRAAALANPVLICNQLQLAMQGNALCPDWGHGELAAQLPHNDGLLNPHSPPLRCFDWDMGGG